MRTVFKEEFESGDKVKIAKWARHWYEKRKPELLDVEMEVDFQYGEEVWTDKGIFGFDELELVEETE